MDSAATRGPLRPSPPNHDHDRSVDDWEDWEDDDIITPIDTDEQTLIDPPPSSRPTKSARSSRHSTSKIRRLKSRQRQKAQNAKAGITLITDMAALRKPGQNAAQQLLGPDGKPVKFVDAAALKALEGEPSSASVGNWNWLKRSKGPSPASATPKQTPQSAAESQLSPEDRPIYIGIALPSDVDSNDISPNTAAIDAAPTPLGVHNMNMLRVTNAPGLHDPPGTTPTSQQRSVWSPDTPDTSSSFVESPRPVSSIYSQYTGASIATGLDEDIPPVPEVPSNLKKTRHQQLISLELGENGDADESGSPCTLFEEDGSPVHTQTPKKTNAITPDSAGSRSKGWWDHVVTPFADRRLTFSKTKPRLDSPQGGTACDSSPASDMSLSPGDSSQKDRSKPLHPLPKAAPVIIRTPTPRRSPSPSSSITIVNRTGESSARSSPALSTIVTQEKPRVVLAEDQPPPYSPPKNRFGPAVRYRAVFPPGHPLENQFPPSPLPVSPGFPGTMTSQGGVQMDETPTPLPMRPAGTYLPREHAHALPGCATSIERDRRKHEKEEVIARRIGGFWRGRACLPVEGCFGRSGPEGRKRRRVGLSICVAILIILILVIVLPIVLTRPHGTHETESIWVNLTDFPPMPTGVLTIVGPDNTLSRSGCTAPSTLWSCSLPKEDHHSVAPYEPDQPTVIMQIQWDNTSHNAWKVPNGEEPTPVRRRSGGAAAQAGNVMRERGTKNGFKPDPSPPDFKEIFFLGETTDNITSEEKGGEPAPFYISLLSSINDTVDTPLLTRRDESPDNLTDLLPTPDVDSDGGPAPAVMLPNPSQQPVRLFDRGLPTEHYGFYTHFKRTIFLKSVDPLEGPDDKNVPLDEDGGCSKTEANFVVTWAETRVLVQIWTQMLAHNTSQLLDPDDGSDDGSSSRKLVRPGTMPYPVTVTLDTHGGNPDQKLVWRWPIDDRQRINEDGARLLVNKMSFAGSWVNRRGSGDPKLGGFDGGSGGCKCEWVNWVGDAPL